MDSKWYAVYTKPRWEKKVADEFSKRNIESYCPLNKVIRQWSDRKKTVYAPLFNSYVFVHLPAKQLVELHRIEGVISLVHWLGKPAIIKDEEIDTIKRFLNEYSNVQLEKAQVQLNDTVRITKGSLIDNEGKVVEIKNNVVKVALPSLGYIMFAEVDKRSVAKVTEK